MASAGQPEFEIFDDSPRQRRRTGPSLKRPELVLGLALLLLIGVSASGDWWGNQSRLDSYRNGQRYAEQHRWEAARDAYLQAAGYHDAAERSADAGRRISERDTSYANAAIATAHREWARALRDLRAVQEIQPGFRDSESLAGAAEQQVYMLALSGTVAQRPSAQPPGLYWYTRTGWTWLQGSDAASQVRGRGSSCCVVYDVPTPTAQQAKDSSALGARRLMAARNLAGGMTFLPLDSDLAGFDSFTWDAQGVLAEHNERQTRKIADPRLERIWTPYSGLRLAYQAYNGAVSTTLSLPQAPWAALLITPDGQRELLGDYTLATGDHPQTALYLSSFQGNRVLLTVRPGIVQGVWFSPDGRYLLLDEFSPLRGGQSEEHRLVVLALGDSMEAVTAVRMEAPRPISWETNWYSVSFLDSGLYAGKALVRGSPAYDQQLKLIDPARPDRVLALVELGPAVSRFIPHALDSGVLISWTDWIGVQLGHAYVDAAGRSTALLSLTGNWLRLDWARQRGDRLVYTLVDGASYGYGSLYSVLSLSLTGAKGEPSGSTVLYEGNSSQLSALGAETTGRYWAAGAGLLAYLRDGQLYAKTYDGALDLPLNDHITALYSASE